MKMTLMYESVIWFVLVFKVFQAVKLFLKHKYFVIKEMPALDFPFSVMKKIENKLKMAYSCDTFIRE